jgi:hypothetical protein
MTAQEIASKLAPHGCVATPEPPSTVDIGEIKPAMSLECTINGEKIGIDEYLNAQQVADNTRLARGAGCAIAKAFGITDFIYVAGTNWTVTAQTTSTVQAIQKALGDGKIISIHC